MNVQTTVDWQPIETAPQNRAVLIYGNAGMDVCIYDSDLFGQGSGGWYAFSATDDHTLNLTQNFPTHWAELPDPPERSKVRRNQTEVNNHALAG